MLSSRALTYCRNLIDPLQVALRASVSQENRELGLVEHLYRRSAQHPLAGPGMTVGAHHDEVGGHSASLFEEHVAHNFGFAPEIPNPIYACGFAKRNNSS